MPTLARYCRVGSCLATSRNHGIRPVDAIHAVLTGHPWLLRCGQRLPPARARDGPAGIGCPTMSLTDAAACRLVAAHYGRQAAGIRRLGAGEWSRAYGFVLDGRAVVIWFGDHVEDFRKDQVMAAHSSTALPIPPVIEIGAAGDGYFAVSQRAPGQLLDGLDGAGMRAVLPGLLAALDAVRAIDVSGTQG